MFVSDVGMIVAGRSADIFGIPDEIVVRMST